MRPYRKNRYGCHNPHPVDIHVGQKIRTLRTLRGMTQEGLAEALGLTFQQVQKYECATNRVSSSRLWMIAEILSVDISYFFKDYGEIETSPIGDFATRKNLKLIRNFNAIADKAVVEALYRTIKVLGRGKKATTA